MSYKETIEANNTAIASNNAELEELIEMANALPDAGSGDESSTVDAIVDGTITELRSNATIVREHAFWAVDSLTKVDLLQATRIPAMAFYNCSALATLILRSSNLCSLVTTSALFGTAIANGTGYIYVPSALIDQYKAAENWSTHAAQFRALEDYTVDGTITGELDESKI